MVKLGTVCLNVKDWRRAAGFWGSALGYTPHPEAEDVLVSPTGEGPQLGLYRDQTHFDLYTSGPEEQRTEIERLTSLGAERVEDWPYPDGADFVVMRDTEGNLFCILDHSYNRHQTGLCQLPGHGTFPRDHRAPDRTSGLPRYRSLATGDPALTGRARCGPYPLPAQDRGGRRSQCRLRMAGWRRSRGHLLLARPGDTTGHQERADLGRV